MEFHSWERIIGELREDDPAIVFTVTDAAGQKHSTGTSRIVTQNPIQLEIIPESDSKHIRRRVLQMVTAAS